MATSLMTPPRFLFLGGTTLFVLGALGIIVMLFAPRGIWGFVAERTNLTLFPTRRRLVVDGEA